MTNEVRFIDTTVRDGNQSLWALNMRIGAMLPALPHIDEAGYESMEFFLSVIFKKYVREHKENPWYWLKEGTKRIKKTRLRYHGGMHSAFEKTPHALLKLLVERLVSYGLTLTRTSNCWNDYSAFADEIKDLKKAGMDTVANLIYSVSPRHTDEYYAKKSKEAAAAKPWRICFKDVGGLLTPEWASATELSGRRQTRHAHITHRDSAARQRIVATICFQYRQQPKSARLHAEYRSKTPRTRGEAFYCCSQERWIADRQTGGIRSFALPAPSARRHDLQHAPPAQDRWPRT